MLTIKIGNTHYGHSIVRAGKKFRVLFISHSGIVANHTGKQFKTYDAAREYVKSQWYRLFV